MSTRLQGALGQPGAAKKEATPFELFRHQITTKLRKDIEALIGKDKVDGFIRVCLNSVQYEPKLLGADRRSLFLACLDAAQDGLMPDGNEAVFNIYPTKTKVEGREVWVDQVQYLPMVYGLVQKMHEIPGVTGVDAVAVYDEDEFRFQRGDDPKIEHVPYDGDGDPGKVKAAYVVLKFKDREVKREVMFRRDIEKVRAKSKQPNGLMWKEDGGFYDQGAIKSVIHRVYKQLPNAERLRRALAHDNKVVGLADVVTPSDEVSTNLEALVDMRMDADMRKVPEGGIIHEGDAVVVGGGAGQPQHEAEVAGASGTGGAASSTGGAAATTGATGSPGPAPKQGDPGTPELKEKFLRQLDASTSVDVLEIVMDDTRFYKWSVEDSSDLAVRYSERKTALKA